MTRITAPVIALESVRGLAWAPPGTLVTCAGTTALAVAGSCFFGRPTETTGVLVIAESRELAAVTFRLATQAFGEAAAALNTPAAPLDTIAGQLPAAEA